MTGTKNGVTAQIMKLNEKGLLMHCCCHSLNLSVGATLKYIPLLKDILDMAYEITQLIKKSRKREAEFHRKQAEFLEQKKLISMFMIWTHQPRKSSAQIGELSELHLCVLF